jgi:calcineurin-like phosphoesterase family protein
MGFNMPDKTNVNRRKFIKTTVASGAVAVPYFATTVSTEESHGAQGDSHAVKLAFGVINDVHHTTIEHQLGPDIGEHSEWIKAFTEAMNGAGASFVVSNGDQVHEGHNGGIGSRYKEDEFASNLRTYQENMRRFKGPSYYVLGNHESCGAIDKDGIRSIWHHPDDNQFIPHNYFHFDYPQAKLRFLVLDSQYEPDGSDKPPLCTGYAEGYIPREQLQWLREQLDDARRKEYLAIIFNHQILGDIHYPYGVSNAGEVQRLIESYADVLPVTFHGHLHDNVQQRQNGVTYVSARRWVADLSADWAKRSGDWLLVEVFDDNHIEITGHGAALSLKV